MKWDISCVLNPTVETWSKISEVFDKSQIFIHNVNFKKIAAADSICEA